MHHSELNIFRNKPSNDKIIGSDATAYAPKHITIGDLFIEFLNDHCIKDEFENNIKKHGGYNSLNQLMKEKTPIGWIMFSFPWSKYSRTYEFWSELNRNWKKRIDYKIEEYRDF